MHLPVICFILFIPYLSGNSISSPSAVTNIKPPNKTSESHSKDTTNLTIITEGGSVNPELPITLPKENHSNLINLDKELVKTKVKSIVPRKGVKYEDNTTNSTKERMDTTILDTKTDAKVPAVNEPTPTKPSTTSTLPSSKSSSASSESVNITSATAETKIKKKPLTLSVEAINETERKVAKANSGTSAKPVVHDQIPVPKVKYEERGSLTHPGMVMPVVITMLVVPMFAVLGYMALRRGQEAWKNRHYKRMDFLLDGMYNE